MAIANKNSGVEKYFGVYDPAGAPKNTDVTVDQTPTNISNLGPTDANSVFPDPIESDDSKKYSQRYIAEQQWRKEHGWTYDAKALGESTGDVSTDQQGDGTEQGDVSGQSSVQNGQKSDNENAQRQQAQPNESKTQTQGRGNNFNANSMYTGPRRQSQGAQQSQQQAGSQPAPSVPQQRVNVQPREGQVVNTGSKSMELQSKGYAMYNGKQVDFSKLASFANQYVIGRVPVHKCTRAVHNILSGQKKHNVSSGLAGPRELYNALINSNWQIVDISRGYVPQVGDVFVCWNSKTYNSNKHKHSSIYTSEGWTSYKREGQTPWRFNEKGIPKKYVLRFKGARSQKLGGILELRKLKHFN